MARSQGSFVKSQEKDANAWLNRARPRTPRKKKPNAKALSTPRRLQQTLCGTRKLDYPRSWPKAEQPAAVVIKEGLNQIFSVLLWKDTLRYSPPS